MPHPVTPSDCPSRETLADFADRPQDFPEVARHLGQCAECAAIVEGYHRLDDTLADLFPAPDGLADRICDACHAAAEKDAADALFQPATPRFHFGALLRQAAALVAAAVLGALAVTAWQRRHATAEAAPLPPALAAETAPTQDGFSLQDSLAMRANAAATGDLTPVSAAGAAASKAVAARPRVRIPGEVTHVWVLPPGKKALADRLLKLADSKPEVVLASEVASDGVATIRLRAEDLAVQRLVDRLYKEGGCTLLSPDFPQPGESAAVAFRKAPVDYTMKLIPGERK